MRYTTCSLLFETFGQTLEKVDCQSTTIKDKQILICVSKIFKFHKNYMNSCRYYKFLYSVDGTVYSL